MCSPAGNRKNERYGVSKQKKIIDLINTLPHAAKNFFIVSQLIEEIQSTNEIEGVSSTRKEIADAYHSSGHVRFKGIVNMYDQIVRGELKLIQSPSDFRGIYDILVKDEIEPDNLPDGEMFRSDSVYVSAGDRHVHQGDPDESSIVQHLDDLIVFMNDSAVPLLIKAIITHCYFEYIHPFYDGNGRMGRYLFSAYIARKLDILSGISLSSAIIHSKKTYEDAFIEASHPKNMGELTFFVRDLIQIILSSQERMLDLISLSCKRADNADNYLKNHDYSEFERNILFIMFQNQIFNPSRSEITSKQIAEELALSRYKVDRVLKELQNRRSIEQVSKKPISYRLSNSLIKIIE